MCLGVLGVPSGSRTRVSDVKSRGPGPLDDGDLGGLLSRTPDSQQTDAVRERLECASSSSMLQHRGGATEQNPENGVAKHGKSMADEVRQAVESARGVQPEWASRPLADRTAALERAAKRMLRDRQTILHLVKEEMGKHEVEALFTEAVGPLDAVKGWSKIVSRALDRRVFLNPIVFPKKKAHVDDGAARRRRDHRAVELPGVGALSLDRSGAARGQRRRAQAERAHATLERVVCRALRARASPRAHHGRSR